MNTFFSVILLIVGVLGLMAAIAMTVSLLRARYAKATPITKEAFLRHADELRKAGWEVQMTEDEDGYVAAGPRSRNLSMN